MSTLYSQLNLIFILETVSTLPLVLALCFPPWVRGGASRHRGRKPTTVPQPSGPFSLKYYCILCIRGLKRDFLREVTMISGGNQNRKGCRGY